MNGKTDDRLDQLLRTWADDQRVDEANVERLRKRILSQLQDVVTAHSVSAPHAVSASIDAVGRPANKFWKSVALVSLSSAALLLITLVVVLSGKQPGEAPQTAKRTHGTGQANHLPPEFVWLDNDQLAGKRALLQEMERVFSDRLAWVAESNGRVDMGLVEDEGPSDAAGKALAIRVVVIRRTPDHPSGTPLWAIDLVTHDEQLVCISPSKLDETAVSLWAFVMPDGNIAIDTNLDLHGAAALHPSTSSVQEPGKPHVVYSRRDGETEYVVYQTVSVL